MYGSIQITDLEFSFPHKKCFEDFSTQIPYGSRIAIIGRNGSGKSSLLKIICGELSPSNGKIKIPDGAVLGYVPQIIDDNIQLSGGQRFNESFTSALSLKPSILLLDEPTNHLDSSNRKSLMRMLNSYMGTLIVVSHDVELIKNCIDTLWHIENGKVRVFSGDYEDYVREIRIRRQSIENELSIVVCNELYAFKEGIQSFC